MKKHIISIFNKKEVELIEFICKKHPLLFKHINTKQIKNVFKIQIEVNKDIDLFKLGRFVETISIDKVHCDNCQWNGYENALIYLNNFACCPICKSVDLHDYEYYIHYMKNIK